VFLLANIGFAQQITLTPQQQAMLDQLPPSQRQQALAALEELNRQRQADESAADVLGQLPTIPQQPGMELGEELEEEEPEVEGGSRLVISLTPREDLLRNEKEDLAKDAALQQISGTNYFELDDAGVLVLPGLPTISLLGLTEEAITQRLTAEPALKVFDVEVFLLDVQSAAADILEPFGYDVFDEPESGRFLPVTSGPVPPDYVLGPGDTIRVQLFGNVNGIYEFEVTRDGILNLPELGPITVAGLPRFEYSCWATSSVRVRMSSAVSQR
jgi:hypothetical protein